MRISPAAQSKRNGGAGWLGTGLRRWELAALLAAAVAVFLLWDGPLWRAPPGASHVGRIAVSYLLVIPLAAAWLLARRRWSGPHLLGSVALLWAAKLVVTASLYSYLAAGSASRYAPAGVAQPARPSAPRAGPAYRPAPAPQGLADFAGIVLDRGVPAAGAVVLFEAPPPGLPLPAPSDGREAPLAIEGARYSESTVLAHIHDRIVVTNRDAALHTFRLARDGRLRSNTPVPPRAGAAVAAPEAGVYDVSCSNHASERATLVVVDHPYAARTDAAGRFLIRAVPEDAHRFAVVRHGSPLARREVRGSAAAAMVTIDLQEEPR